MFKALIFCVSFIQLLVRSQITDLECQDDESMEWKTSSGEKRGFEFKKNGQAIAVYKINDDAEIKDRHAVLHYTYRRNPAESEMGHWILKNEKTTIFYCETMKDEIKSILSDDSVIAIQIGTHMVKGTAIPVSIHAFADKVTFQFIDVHARSRRVVFNHNDQSVIIGAQKYIWRKFSDSGGGHIEWMNEDFWDKITRFYTTGKLKQEIIHNLGRGVRIVIGSYAVYDYPAPIAIVPVHRSGPTSPEPESGGDSDICAADGCRSRSKCDIWDTPMEEIPLGELSHAPEVDYEFYGTKSSAEGGVERDGNEIKCNGVVVFQVDKTSRTLSPWNWRWRLASNPDQLYTHADGLVFLNVHKKYYVQLLPVPDGGCILQGEISYFGRTWAFENDDLANYNLYMWTFGNNLEVPDLKATIHPVVYCNGNFGAQKGMWCQLYAQNNVLQYEVDGARSYAAFEKGEKVGVWETHTKFRKEGFETKKLKPGLQRFGLTLFPKYVGLLATPERMQETTPEFMKEHQCIGVLVRYAIDKMKETKTKGKYESAGRGAHFITFKYLGGQGWYWLDANVKYAHGPFKTFVEAEQDANAQQLKRNDHREITLRRVARQMSRGHIKPFYWKVRSKIMYFVVKEIDYFKEISKSIASSSGTAPHAVMNYENEYEKYEPIYGSGPHRYMGKGYSRSYVGDSKLSDYSMETIISVWFLGFGFCLFAIIGFLCSCSAFSVCYLFTKYQQNNKRKQNQLYDHEIANDENEEV